MLLSIYVIRVLTLYKGQQRVYLWDLDPIIKQKSVVDPMIKIKVKAQDTEESVEQIKNVLGGAIEEQWGQHQLKLSNDKAKGTIRFITFDWGVSLLELDITFFDEVLIEVDTSDFNPISFYYCLEGYCGHKFGYQPEEKIKIMEQFQSVILTNRDGGITDRYFPKDVKISQTVIQVRRKPFLRKRLNQGEELNKKLYEVGYRPRKGFCLLRIL